MALKKPLYNADLFIAEDSKPTNRDRRTNTSDTIDYIISSPAFYSNFQNLTLNNDLSSDHFTILFDFSTNVNKYPLPIKVKLYNKAEWDSINSSLSKQLAILQDQILNLISSNNHDSINIINNAAIIPIDSIMSIHNNFPEKKKLNQTPAYHSLFNFLEDKKEKSRVFIKTRNPFLESTLSAIPLKNKN